MIRRFILNITVVMFVCFCVTACSEDSDVSLYEETISSSGQSESQWQNTKDTASDKVVVYVNGAVRKSGVYTLKKGDRVYQAIRMAGGMTKNAQKDVMNLAETVVDAENIYVMTKREYKKSHTKGSGTVDKYGKGTSGTDERMKDTGTDIVNINTADKERLTTLPGIGDSKAAAIISYREENGPFSSKEDIKNVSGIGEATYTNIEEMITI